MTLEANKAVEKSLNVISDKDRSTALKNTKQFYEACKVSMETRMDYTDMVVEVGLVRIL